MEIRDPSLVWLVGPAGAGKSTWAAARFAPGEIVSTDELRSRVGSGPADLDASADAFELAETIASRRLARRLTTVVDSLGFDEGLRARLARIATDHGVERVAIVFDTPLGMARQRNRQRSRRVPADVLDGQFRRMPQVVAGLAASGWRVESVPASTAPAPTAPASSGSGGAPGPVHFHLARFPTTDFDALVRDVAVSAEQAGFGGISVMDHLVQIPQVGREWDPAPEAVTLLAYMAAVTRRIRLTLLVGNVPMRGPLPVFGRQLATVDVVSGGRLTCGLGAGWFRAEYEAYGIPLPPPGARLDVLEDAIGCFRALWGPGAPGYTGRTMSVPRAIGYPRPVQDRIPILVGGKGDRTLRIAARAADGWNVVGGREEYLRSRDVIHRHCDAIGRDPATLQGSILDAPVVGRDRSEVADLVEAHRGRHPAARFMQRHPTGTPDIHAARYRALVDLGVGSIYVSPTDVDPRRAIDRLAPVLAAMG